ncbi:MAG: type II toxin-antitoxin system RelE/ParE family toxin [Bacteroidota bacterium]
MSLPVNWSASSKAEYAELLKHLQDHFGLDAAMSYMDKMDERILQISNFPESGRATKKESVRRVTITPQTSVIYEIYDQTIEILYLWDNRQNPDKLEEVL